LYTKSRIFNIFWNKILSIIKKFSLFCKCSADMQNVFLGSQKCGIFLRGECGRVSTAILILPMPCWSFCFSFNSQPLILLCPWYSWCGTHLWDLSAAAILLLFCVLCSGAYVNVYRTDRKHVSNAAGPEKRLQRGWTISRTPRKSSRTGGKKTVKENTQWIRSFGDSESATTTTSPFHFVSPPFRFLSHDGSHFISSSPSHTHSPLFFAFNANDIRQKWKCIQSLISFFLFLLAMTRILQIRDLSLDFPKKEKYIYVWYQRDAKDKGEREWDG